MRVKLYESKWLHTIAGELADRFHDSIEAGDLAAVKQSSKDLLEKCKEFFDPEEDDYVIMEIDELIESFDTVDDDEEEVDFLLDQLYDFCDGYNIWISLGNTAEDEPKEPEEEPEPVEEPVEAEAPVEEPAPESEDEPVKEALVMDETSIANELHQALDDECGYLGCSEISWDECHEIARLIIEHADSPWSGSDIRDLAEAIVSEDFNWKYALSDFDIEVDDEEDED